MTWNKKNRVFSLAFVMSSIFCGVLTLMGSAELFGTAIIFLILAAITYWFSTLGKDTK